MSFRDDSNYGLSFRRIQYARHSTDNFVCLRSFQSSNSRSGVGIFYYPQDRGQRDSKVHPTIKKGSLDDNVGSVLRVWLF